MPRVKSAPSAKVVIPTPHKVSAGTFFAAELGGIREALNAPNMIQRIVGLVDRWRKMPLQAAAQSIREAETDAAVDLWSSCRNLSAAYRDAFEHQEKLLLAASSKLEIFDEVNGILSDLSNSIRDYEAAWDMSAVELYAAKISPLAIGSRVERRCGQLTRFEFLLPVESHRALLSDIQLQILDLISFKWQGAKVIAKTIDEHMSDEAVRQHISKIRKCGLEILFVRGKGYFYDPLRKSR